MATKKDTLDQLLDGRASQAVISKDGLFDELKKALAERVLNAEIDDHPASLHSHDASCTVDPNRSLWSSMPIRMLRVSDASPL
jgi:transposase-like protein